MAQFQSIWRRLPLFLALNLCALILAAPAFLTPAQAQELPLVATTAEPPVDLATLRKALDGEPTSAQNLDESRSVRANLARISEQAQSLIVARTAELNDLNARLGELGEAPGSGTTEDADITRQRTSLTRTRNSVDADIRLARLIVVDAQQRATELLTQRRQNLQAQISERAFSPLSRPFWRDMAQAWPDDRERLENLAQAWQSAVTRALSPAHRDSIMATLAVAVLLMTLVAWLAERALAQVAQRLLPGGRLRRSLLVMAVVLTQLLLVALALRLCLSSFEARGLISAQLRELAQMLARALLFMAFVTSLGRALLSNARASWRLPNMDDAMARRLRSLPLLTALTLVVAWLPFQIVTLIGASNAALMATRLFSALVLAVLIATMLVLLRPKKLDRTAPALATSSAQATAPARDAGEHASASPAPSVPQRLLWITLFRSAVGLALGVIAALAMAGYLALASLIAGQLTWALIVGCTFYVLFKFADDLFTALLSPKSPFGMRLQNGFDLAPTTLSQSAVVLSAVARLTLFFYMLITLAAPLGTDPVEVFQRSGTLGSGLKVGEFEIVPSAIFSALSVLLAGWIALRVGRAWLQDRYLPATSLEAGMQSSITTLLGYVGAVVVVAFSLSALGIGVNRIAWIASALSVGIGFGLQAIVQNFISGLILLAERPVKVGDWVALGTTEGDVKRISVRATEIQLGDRSTVIVPNSEFITKIVRNVTLANAEGRVLIRLPMPLNTDAQKVRELMLAACCAHPKVLDQPAPSLTLEGIEDKQLIFQLIAYVNSPRVAGGVRSELLFSILDAFRAADLPLIST